MLGIVSCDFFEYGLWFFFRHNHFPARYKSVEEDDERNDSVWATVASFVKNFNVSFDYVLNDMPFVNIIMYNRTLPDYNLDKDKDKKGTKNKRKSNKPNLLDLDNDEWNNYLNH